MISLTINFNSTLTWRVFQRQHKPLANRNEVGPLPSVISVQSHPDLCSSDPWLQIPSILPRCVWSSHMSQAMMPQHTRGLLVFLVSRLRALRPPELLIILEPDNSLNSAHATAEKAFVSVSLVVQAQRIVVLTILCCGCGSALFALLSSTFENKQRCERSLYVSSKTKTSKSP